MNSPAYAELAAITNPSKIAHAERWGDKFLHIVDKALGGHRGAWRRPELWLRTLREKGDIFFLGADAAITNIELPLCRLYMTGPDGITPDLIISADGNGLQSDSFIMRSNERTIKFLEDVLKWEGYAANEQDAMNIVLSGSNSVYNYGAKVGLIKREGEPPPQHILDQVEVALNGSRVRVRLVPQADINAYENSLYGGSKNASNQWTPSSFVCHLPGLPNSVRIPFFKSIL